MFIEINDNSGNSRIINIAYIVQIFPDGGKTGIKLIDYKVIIHVDMNYNDFIAKFKSITNNWRTIS